VDSQRARLTATFRRFGPSATPILFIIAAVFVGNGVYLLGLGDLNPISWTSGIAHAVCHSSCGRPMIDPNVGFITQPLGHLAAMDLLHFHLPWWNYFEGLGQPLAGEMQSAALFPLTLLFALPSGLLWFHISLEVVAGVSTYFLAKRLGANQLIATTGAILFALNGTYAWLGNAVLNPIAFLPMLILGIEMIYDGARSGARKGWHLAAIAIALSLYAGFPEVAFFDALFCAGWAIVRFFDVPKENRLTAARRLGLSGLVGLLLSLPILIPFLDFMKVAIVGSHTAAVAGVSRLTLRTLPMFFDPYIYGQIFRDPNATGPWGAIGGYFTASVTLLALLGLLGKRLRPLRIFMGAWIIVAIFGMTDFLNLRSLWNSIPLVSTATLPRYIMPSCEIAMILLAVLGLIDFATTTRAKRFINLTTLLALLILVWGVYLAGVINQGVVLHGLSRYIHLILDAAPFVAVLAIGIVARFSKRTFAPFLLCFVLVAESLVIFIVPSGDAPIKTVIDTAPIIYLRAHQGEERFLDFAVIFPNYGSQFGLNSLGAIDLPFPKAFSHYIETKLYPGLAPANQFIIKNGGVGELAQEQQLVNHFGDYESASVKYLVMPTNQTVLPALANLGVTKVFSDTTATIYKMPHARPFFSTSSPSCSVTSSNVSSATVNCPNGATTLLRTELSMAGWHASVNGQSVPITTVDGVFQSVAVPQGTSTIAYSFLPPHEKYAVLLGLLAAFFLAGAWVRERFSALRTPRHAKP
jgi:hypothetical protein